MNRFIMTLSAVRPFSRHLFARASQTRQHHGIITDSTTRDITGLFVSNNLPAIIGNPGDAYLNIEPSVGQALPNMHQFLWRERKTDVNLCSPIIHNPLAAVGFFLYVYTGHVLTRDEIHAKNSRLHNTNQPPRQSKPNSSPASLFLWKMCMRLF